MRCYGDSKEKRDLILIRSQKIGFKDTSPNDVKSTFRFKRLMRFGDRSWEDSHVEECSRQNNIHRASNTRESMRHSKKTTSP